MNLATHGHRLQPIGARTLRAVLDNDYDQLRTELIQVAAVAVAWLEAL